MFVYILSIDVYKLTHLDMIWKNSSLLYQNISLRGVR